MNPRSSLKGVFGGISGGVFLIGLALAFLSNGYFLPILFVTLAFTSLIGSLSSLNPRALYGGIQGFFWMLVLALFFYTDNWIWFLVGAGISAILGALIQPITAALLGIGIFGIASTMTSNQQPNPTYQQGYQATQQQTTYQEGGQQHTYTPPPQQEPYEQPHAEYPQQMPPQQS